MQKVKREMTIVIYTLDGQHLTVDCDKLEQGYNNVSVERDRINLGMDQSSLNLFVREDPENEDSAMRLIASFERRNIAGWERIR